MKTEEKREKHNQRSISSRLACMKELLSDGTMPIQEPSTSSAGTTPAAPNLPWVEKYRPNALDELISHEDIIGTIRKFISQDKLPHLLFYGPPGTGKTSTILACAKEIYSKKVIQLDGEETKLVELLSPSIFFPRNSIPWCWS